MILLITLKTPDAVNDAIIAMTENEQEREELYEYCKTWFNEGESVSLRVDTKADTCTVLPTIYTRYT